MPGRRFDPHTETRLCLVDIPQGRLVVAADEQLMGWPKVEKVATHEACGQPVATGEVLDLCFVPAAALLSFLSDDQTPCCGSVQSSSSAHPGCQSTDARAQNTRRSGRSRARQEIAAIIVRSIVRHRLAHAAQAVALTAMQFVDVRTGGAMEPLMSRHTRSILTRYAPALVPHFDAAHQQTDDIDVSDWSEWVVVPISIIASFALPVLAMLLWRRGRRREAMLPALLFLALLGNAALCSIVSSSNDRYQARLVWLAELAVGLAVQAMARRHDRTETGIHRSRRRAMRSPRSSAS